MLLGDVQAWSVFIPDDCFNLALDFHNPLCLFLQGLVHVSANEQFIIRRLEREKRCGKVTQIDSESWRFEIDVYDSMELLPWIRTFTGRIISLKSTNSAVVKQYYEDLEKMALLLGGE